MIDKIKEYWNRVPCNIRHSPSKIGSLEWSREITERKYFVEPHIKEFADFDRWYGSKVLEIGCGIGTDTLMFVKHKAVIDSVDISEKSIELAKMRFTVEKPYYQFNANFRFFNYNAEEKLPYRNALYDLVYSFGVLHHTPNPEKILKTARVCIDRNGELRIMLYAKWSIKNLTCQQPEAQSGCPLAKTYTAKEVRKLLKECGFKITSIKKTHIFPYKIPEYKNYRYMKHWYYRIMPDWMFCGLERLLGWHLLIVAVPD